MQALLLSLPAADRCLSQNDAPAAHARRRWRPLPIEYMATSPCTAFPPQEEFGIRIEKIESSVTDTYDAACNKKQGDDQCAAMHRKRYWLLQLFNPFFHLKCFDISRWLELYLRLAAMQLEMKCLLMDSSDSPPLEALHCLELSSHAVEALHRTCLQCNLRMPT